MILISGFAADYGSSSGVSQRVREHVCACFGVVVLVMSERSSQVPTAEGRGGMQGRAT